MSAFFKIITKLLLILSGHKNHLTTFLQTAFVDNQGNSKVLQPIDGTIELISILQEFSDDVVISNMMSSLIKIQSGFIN